MERTTKGNKYIEKMDKTIMREKEKKTKDKSKKERYSDRNDQRR